MSWKHGWVAAFVGTLAIGTAAPTVRSQEATDDARAETVVVELVEAVDPPAVESVAPSAAVEGIAQQYRAVVDAIAGEATESTPAEPQPTLWIGVRLATEVPPALAHHLPDLKGALVESVFPESPAAETGVEPYDLIVKLGDVDVTSNETLIDAMRAAEPKTMELIVRRGGKTRKLSVAPRERAEPAQEAVPGLDLSTVTPNDLVVPHMRLLPGLQGDDPNALAARLTTQYFHAAAPPTLPENVESLTIRVERDGDQVTSVVTAHTVDGKTIEARGDEIAKLPPEILAFLPQAGAPHGGPLAFKFGTASAPPTAATVRRLHVVPRVAPSVPEAPAAPPHVAVPAVPAAPANAVWLDVFTQPQGRIAVAPALPPGLTPAVAPPAVPLPSQAIDQIRSDVETLKASMERIEKLLQERVEK